MDGVTITKEIGVIIEALTSKLGVTSSEIVNVYAQNCYVKSWMYLLMGIAIIITAFFLAYAIYHSEDSTNRKKDNLILAIVVFLIIGVLLGGGFICENIADIRHPKAYAIHRLIKDVKPNSD